MTTLAAWVEDTRAHLDADTSEEGNQLDADYVAGSGTITLRHPLGSIAAGAILSVGTNTLRVFATNPVAKTATVSAGWQGSTDADAPAGSLVRVNPRFTDHRIVKELNSTLKSLSSPASGLYKVGTVEVTYNPAVQGYDLTPTGLLDVLEVRRDTTGPAKAWLRVRRGDWSLQRSAPTEDFPSGAALRLTDGCDYAPLAVQVVYAASFTSMSDLAADVSTSGIPATADDIPPLGAAIRLMAGREVARNRTLPQGDSRRSSEVGPGAVAASSRGLQQVYALRVQDEALRLRAQYPIGK